MIAEQVLKETPASISSPPLRIAIFTLDSLYSNYALKNLISLLKYRVEVVFCTQRISNKKYGSFFSQAKKIIAKSGLSLFVYLNLYIFLYRALIYLGAWYRKLKKQQIKLFSLNWMSRRYGFRVVKVSDINSAVVLRTLRKAKVDLVIGIHLDQLVSPNILNTPRLGCLNMHYGELPENAGPFPSIWAVLRRKKTSSATIHYMNGAFDKGDILAQASVPLLEGDSILNFDCRLHKAGCRLLQNVVSLVERGEHIIHQQDLGHFRYKSYPSKKHMKLLRKRGIKLFHWKDFFHYFF